MITAHYGRIVMVILVPITLLFLLYYGYNNTRDNHITTSQPSQEQQEQQQQQQPETNVREKAAFVVLARNSDLFGIRDSMRMMEDRFNRKFNYPWVFLNDEPFDERFKEWTTGIASGETHYGTFGHEMWGYPDWIDQEKAKQTRERMEKEGIIYGGSESYRHMCRFQSGFFFRHPLLDQFDYYWRVEPDVKFMCDVDYDPFKLMRERDLKYGFAISLREYESTIPTLWETTKKFMKKHPEHIIPMNNSESLLSWVTEDGGKTYNLCHFWSNFEIGSIAWLRSKPYLDYFNFLDKEGGFFYERWGDAPVHSIAAAMMLKQSEVHYFYDMGYFHNPFSQCPSEPEWLPIEKCSCDPAHSLDKEYWSCSPRFLQVTGKTNRDFIITQRS